MSKLFKSFLMLIVIASVSACSIGKSLKLAVNCETDEALKVIAEAEKGTGLTANLATLEHEAVLRDAGRIEEADAVRVKRESQPGMTEKEKADAEKAVNDTVASIRKEREKQTGRAECR